MFNSFIFTKFIIIIIFVIVLSNVMNSLAVRVQYEYSRYHCTLFFSDDSPPCACVIVCKIQKYVNSCFVCGI